MEITKEEYEELLYYKKMYFDSLSIKSKKGTGFKKYVEQKNFLDYFKNNSPELYKEIRSGYLKISEILKI